MKRLLITTAFITAIISLFACSNGGGGKSGGGTSLVTLKVDAGGTTARMTIEKNTFFAQAKILFEGLIKSDEAFAAIPSGVTKISFAVSASDMTTMTRDVTSWQGDIEESFDVPNGLRRLFQVSAYDDDNTLLYRGESYEDLDGSSRTVSVNMVAVASESEECTFEEISYSWDGVADDEAELEQSGDDEYSEYDFSEHGISWSFPFYGGSYDKITVDTNGNIWFTYEYSIVNNDYEYDLATGSGQGPVIAAWNLDLSSDSYGFGYRVQHKTSPERIVIEWETETYNDEDSDNYNNFEVILYQDGRIQMDYDDFDCSNCGDFGSGISKGDGVNYQSITDPYGSVYTLGGRSFLFTTTDACAPTMTCGLYVDENAGSDGENNCANPGFPCQSITYALTQTEGNETVCVAEGYYHDGTEMNGHESFPLQLNTGTRLYCQGANHSTVIENDWLEWQGAIVGAEGASVEGCGITNSSPAINDDEHVMTIDNNLIDGGCLGIWISNDSTVTNNTIRNMDESECYNAGIRISGGSPNISGNTITDNDGIIGITIRSNATPAITGNTITNNDTGISIENTANPVINNNVLSCNNQGWQANLENDTANTIDARNNQWDYAPPALGDDDQCYYDDICNLSGGSVDSTGSSVAPSPCTD
ncbi:MAG: DUF1565 domain-containing protein [Nitrospirae bacterium]|nr:DUF1565 domain-containing protein [Nitrospirota bacterium]